MTYFNPSLILSRTGTHIGYFLIFVIQRSTEGSQQFKNNAKCSARRARTLSKNLNAIINVFSMPDPQNKDSQMVFNDLIDDPKMLKTVTI